MSFPKKTIRTPDAVDQWLEAHGFYRKHTARDSTCLFRVFSEQIYLTQKYHEIVRGACVKYMKDNSHLFEKSVEGSYKDYLQAMSGLNEFGGPLEIMAMSKLYSCEVYVFEKMCEPENITNFGYSRKIYMFHLDKHYDSVFDKQYIQEAAFCQSLVYNILYKSVFKMPDVDYAVSTMLHEPLAANNENKSHVTYLTKTSIPDQRKKNASHDEWYSNDETNPVNTLCVLEDVSRCMFHNVNVNVNPSSNCIDAEQNNNTSILKEYEDDKFNRNKRKVPRKIYLKNTCAHVPIMPNSNDADANNNKEENGYASMIPEFVARLFDLTDFQATDPHVSCVKQMLDENLTPFPYKVAKALDPEIYRNIEFDTWNELRRELRYGNWYNGGTNLQVGVKCLVKLSEEQLTWYHCHIQDMPMSGEPCIVFVEELGEKKAVPRDFLQPLPSGQAKPWALPYRHYRNLASNIQNSRLFAIADYDGKCKKSRMYKSRKMKDINSIGNKDDAGNPYSDNKENCDNFDNSANRSEGNNNVMDFKEFHKLHGLTSFQTFPESNMEIIAMPVSIILDNPVSTSNGGTRSSGHMSHFSASMGYNNETRSSNINTQPCTYPYSAYYWSNNQTVDQVNNTTTNTNLYQNAPQTYTTDRNSDSMSGHVQISQNTQDLQYSNGPQAPTSLFSQPLNVNQTYTPPQTRDTNNTPYTINYSAPRSILSSGADLPLNDLPTLRYFYNLGIDYFDLTYPASLQNREIGVEDNLLSSIFSTESTSPGSSNSRGFETNSEDQLCLDFHNNLVLENTKKEQFTNTSFKENKRKSKPTINRHTHGGHSGTHSTDDCTTVNQVATANSYSACATATLNSQTSNINNVAGTPQITEITLPTNISPYMVAYTQVPGMYSTIVPCYPIETEGGNLYIAQYMGVPFGVVPQNYNFSANIENLQSTAQQPENATNYSLTTGSSGSSTYSAIQQSAGPGYYQNQVWYPSQQTSSMMFSHGSYNLGAPYQSASSANPNNNATQ